MNVLKSNVYVEALMIFYLFFLVMFAYLDEFSGFITNVGFRAGKCAYRLG